MLSGRDGGVFRRRRMREVLSEALRGASASIRYQGESMHLSEKSITEAIIKRYTEKQVMKCRKCFGGKV